MRWLVCGGRDLQDTPYVFRHLDRIAHVFGRPDHLVLGGAQGVDTSALLWARARGIGGWICKANWKKFKRAAGPIRNEHMLAKYRPHWVIAFPGGSGTADMVQRAEAAEVAVLHVPAEPG